MKYVFGNWKMYMNYDETVALANTLATASISEHDLTLAVFPLAIATKPVVDAFANTKFAVGAQNVSWTPKGAYTGAVSALMYRELGCKYALIGHSERRHIFGETDADVRKKIEACLENGLTPVVCIGETKTERDSGGREERLIAQIESAFSGLNINGNEVIVAYEPVWAIGTGDACDVAEAVKVHEFVDAQIQKTCGKSLPILYGGSVNAKNVLSYLNESTIMGVLVGNASAKADTFVPLIDSASEISK